jgi:hypothetical protein
VRPTSSYVSIHLSDAISPETVGAYVPDRVAANLDPFDVVVYFHGNIIEACGTDPNKFNKDGIAYYWNTPNFQCLRDELEKSDVNAILIAPTLCTQFGSIQPSWCPRYGNLQLHNQFDWLLQETLHRLDLTGVLSGLKRVRKVVLAAHSAGGMPMMRILEATNATAIDECWGFECLYFGTGPWTEWLHKNPDKMFHHFRRGSEFNSQAAILKTYDNFRDIKGGTDHCSQVKRFWSVALASSAVLNQIKPAPMVVASIVPTMSKSKEWWNWLRGIGR